ncbi:MAG: GNAT family N-acetyltransferase [Betaproteobacteria bacterium]
MQTWPGMGGCVGYVVTTDPARIDVDAVHRYLSEDSYWAKNIPRDVVERSIAHSMCFAILHDDELAGFARITSDHATVAYLGDVFVLPAHRGKGLSKWLMECILVHPQLQGLRRWMLATADAHGLYEQFGFTPFKAPQRWMEKHDPDVYSRLKV